MSEEIKKAYKLFNREDLIDDGYERDLDSNIQVFLTTKQMINYMNLQQKVEKLENIRKEVIDYINNHQLVFRLSSKKQIENWFDEFYKDLLNILNKGSDKE